MNLAADMSHLLDRGESYRPRKQWRQRLDEHISLGHQQWHDLIRLCYCVGQYSLCTEIWESAPPEHRAQLIGLHSNIRVARLISKHDGLVRPIGVLEYEAFVRPLLLPAQLDGAMLSQWRPARIDTIMETDRPDYTLELRTTEWITAPEPDAMIVSRFHDLDLDQPVITTTLDGTAEIGLLDGQDDLKRGQLVEIGMYEDRKHAVIVPFYIT